MVGHDLEGLGQVALQAAGPSEVGPVEEGGEVHVLEPDAELPEERDAWRLGLKALDAEAQARFGARFHELGAWAQDELLKLAEKGDLTGAVWEGMPSKLFFHQRILADVVKAYYAHPTAWNEIGWGGPASPRGYVRMGFDRRDPWEAAEAKPDREAEAFAENLRVGD